MTPLSLFAYACALSATLHLQEPAPAAPVIDPETLADILEAMKSAAARLRGPRCEFSNKLAAASLERARLDLIDALNP